MMSSSDVADVNLNASSPLLDFHPHCPFTGSRVNYLMRQQFSDIGQKVALKRSLEKSNKQNILINVPNYYHIVCVKFIFHIQPYTEETESRIWEGNSKFQAECSSGKNWEDALIALNM